MILRKVSQARHKIFEENFLPKISYLCSPRCYVKIWQISELNIFSSREWFVWSMWDSEDLLVNTRKHRIASLRISAEVKLKLSGEILSYKKIVDRLPPPPFIAVDCWRWFSLIFRGIKDVFGAFRNDLSIWQDIDLWLFWIHVMYPRIFQENLFKFQITLVSDLKLLSIHMTSQTYFFFY